MSDFISTKEVEERYQIIKPYIYKTPLYQSMHYSELIGRNVFLKLENLNFTGSFKIRGAASAILPIKENISITAASAGNHAQGVARICQAKGLPATIFMPSATPLKKVNSTKKFGANVRLGGMTFDDAFISAEEFAKEHNAYLVHAFANRDVIMGQASVGLELKQQLDTCDIVFVPIGGGGLISGVSAYLKQIGSKAKIIGVQTRYYPNVFNSFVEENHPEASQVHQIIKPTIADGIAVKQHQEISDRYIKKFVDEIVLVTENDIALTIFELLEKDTILAEGAGAASVAAMKNYFQGNKHPYKNVVSIISGGNVDINLVDKIISRGLLQTGRHLRVAVTIPDKPNSLANLLTTIGSLGGNILDIEHNRAFSSSDYYEVDCFCDIETTDAKHKESIVDGLRKAGYQNIKEKGKRFKHS